MKGRGMRGKVARKQWAAVVALGLAASAALAACGIAGASTSSVAHKDPLVIGVYSDQPGVGQKVGTDYQGADIDFAKQIAAFLHVRKVEFKTITADNRAGWIRNGTVDLVVGSYSITPERKKDVAFAGPYYVAHQSILVRASDAAKVTNVHQLAGRRVCRVKKSVSYPRVEKERGVPVTPVDASGYEDCLTKLVTNKLDAVSTDDVILAGLYGENVRNGGPPLKLVNTSFSDEPWGVGIKQSDVDGCEAVNKAITEMYRKGIPGDLLEKRFQGSGLTITRTVPQFEGCE